jgi:hypothetical protein
LSVTYVLNLHQWRGVAFGVVAAAGLAASKLFQVIRLNWMAGHPEDGSAHEKTLYPLLRTFAALREIFFFSVQRPPKETLCWTLGFCYKPILKRDP